MRATEIVMRDVQTHCGTMVFDPLAKTVCQSRAAAAWQASNVFDFGIRLRPFCGMRRTFRRLRHGR